MKREIKLTDLDKKVLFEQIAHPRVRIKLNDETSLKFCYHERLDNDVAAVVVFLRNTAALITHDLTTTQNKFNKQNIKGFDELKWYQIVWALNEINELPIMQSFHDYCKRLIE